MTPEINAATPDLATRAHKEALHGHAGLVVALTGLPAAGKTTLARLVESGLTAAGVSVAVLDGDEVRKGLCDDLGFGLQERSENLRRLGEVAAIMLEAGMVVLIAAIMPRQADRRRLRERFAGSDFLEVFVSCDLDICQKRDPKGLYDRARRGIISDFTGVTSPYEEPMACELIVRTDREPVRMGAKRICEAVLRLVRPGRGQSARRRGA